MASEVATRIAQVAEQLQALAANGLHYGTDPYDIERFEHVRDLAAELLSCVDGRTSAEIGQLFVADLGVRTPRVTVDAAIFATGPESGREPGSGSGPESGGERAGGVERAGGPGPARILLTRRTDNGLWCMPGGACEVGERPSAGAEREAWEETGLRVRATRVIGVYDNRSYGVPEPVRWVHAYQLVFECDPVGGGLTPSIEASEFVWATEQEAMQLPLFGSHLIKVPAAFRLHASPAAPAAFH